VPFAIIASRPLVVTARISHGQRLFKNSEDIGYFIPSEDLGVRSRLFYHEARFNWHKCTIGAVLAPLKGSTSWQTLIITFSVTFTALKQKKKK